MRVMVIIKANEESEAGVMPSQELLTQMGNFNEELVKAGVMQAGEGLQPSSNGKRVRFSGSSIDEAIEWVKRCPNPMNGETEVEIRPVFEMADFGDELTPAAREQEERLRAKMASKQASA